jgi:aryl-alcohol dehydrogenase-like predicted oxidoreductase
MAMRKLGNTGIEVSPIAFGGNVFGWTVDEATSFELLDSWIAGGFNFVDTADVYSNWVPGHVGGESETIIGKWMKLRGNRAKMVIATKVGHEMAPDKKGLKKDYIFRSCDESLKRLQTDYIDLYQSHKDDPDTPQEETLAAYAELIKQGKVRAIGASNFTAERLDSALQLSEKHGLPRYASLQPLYNLYDRADYEATLEHLCREKKLAVIPYFSLAAGFLTGKYRSEADLDKSPRGARVKRYLDDRGFRILKTLDIIAQQIGSTPGKIAIAWLLARHSITAPIASATNQIQLHDLIAATKLKLAQSHIEMLNH